MPGRRQLCHGLLRRSLCPARRPMPTTSFALRPVGSPRRGRMVPGCRLEPRAERAFETSATPLGSPLDDAASSSRPSAAWEADWDTEASRLQPLLAPAAPTAEMLEKARIDDIVAAIMAMRDPRGWAFNGRPIDRWSRIIQLVQHLVRDRDQPLSSFVYESVMEAMADPCGSAETVRRLLDDMESQGIRPTATLCQNALTALAVHPDYVLRQEIIATMQRFWFALDTAARQSIVLGLLRDGQNELAYSRLLELVEQDAQVDLWLYDIFIFAFGRLGFLDEMLLLLRRRRAATPSPSGADDITSTLLYHALDLCSQAFHHAGTAMSWTTIVSSSLLPPPPDGVLEQVLATAARHGDPTMATQAFERLARRTRLRPHHYEAVAEAFSRQGDVPAALRIFRIMDENGIAVSRRNTRVLYQLLRRRPHLIDTADDALRELRRRPGEQRKLPLALVGLVIEATAQVHGSERAMDLYHAIPSLSGEPPDRTMLGILVINSRQGETRRLLAHDFLLYTASDSSTAAGEDNSDMDLDEAAVQMAHIFRLLIPACLETGDLDLAFKLASRALGPASSPAPLGHLAWLEPLVQSAAVQQDGRIWRIVDAVAAGGDGPTKEELQRLLRQMHMANPSATETSTTRDAL